MGEGSGDNDLQESARTVRWADAVVDDETKKKKKKSSSKKKKGWEDRYFGLFHCKGCDKRWQSAHVYTVGGTRKVKYKQACKGCTGEEAWVFPYHIQLISCSVCRKDPCVCLCEECGKLKHKRPDDNGVIHDRREFCSCGKSKKSRSLNDKDNKKPHLADLCGKCKSGRPCGRSG